MKQKNTLLFRLLLIGIIPFALITGGCSTSKKLSKNAGSGIELKYDYSSGKDLHYKFSTTIDQFIDVPGQPMDIAINELLDFSLSPGGKKGNDIIYKVIVNSMTLNVDAPGMETNPDLSGLKGKSFNMTLSQDGKEFDLSDAKNLSYEVSGESQSIETEFQMIFPKLPEKPVKIGDTWPTKDVVVERSSGSEITMNFNNVNTLEGFEKINGINCAKITMVSAGTRKGNQSAQGMDLMHEGTVKGTSVIYFAIDGGYFVKYVSEGSQTGIINISGMQDMSIAVSAKIITEIRLVK